MCMRTVLAIMLVVYVAAGITWATPHLEPAPAGLAYDTFLEAESASSMAPVWNPLTLGGVDSVYRAPSYSDDSGWFQWEGLSLATGDYHIYVSWTRPGSGWTYPNKVLAGPDANNLREVLPYWESVGLVSYTLEWDPVGATNGTNSLIPLLSTDTVIKVITNYSGAEFYVDSVMLTTDVPEPATMALVGLGVLGLVRRRK